MSSFYKLTPKIHQNSDLREPQIQAFTKFAEFFDKSDECEAGVVMPVGCGKSGCITIFPFACNAKRTLVVAPNLHITKQLVSDFSPSDPKYFYKKCKIVSTDKFPETVEIRGKLTNKSDLDEADVVITNIQQLQGKKNRWIQDIPNDFFDLILFDEGHHTVAESWANLKAHFPEAKIVNFSATPLRADGQKMAGEIIYYYPITEAIEKGYIKSLKAIVLNPKTLKFIREENGNEVEIPLEEVKNLGESDSKFRKSILTSAETLGTIVDASIGELNKKRKETGEKRLKIIAAALNYNHCVKIVEAYRARGLLADYIHSKEDGETNKKVLQKLENHQLDVIVQVRKLGEGFDHIFLSVAAVFNVFSNLSPFVQFVGRIMRVITQNEPNNILNTGTVIFHAGANIANRWSDFQEFSEADQTYYDAMLPLEQLDFTNSDELVIDPETNRNVKEKNSCHITAQNEIRVEEISLLKMDPEVQAAISVLHAKGYPSDLTNDYKELERIPVTKQKSRQAKKKTLDDQVKLMTKGILKQHNIRFEGKELDKHKVGKTNFVTVKSALDKEINTLVGKNVGERHEISLEELNLIEANLEVISEKVTKVMFNG